MMVHKDNVGSGNCKLCENYGEYPKAYITKGKQYYRSICKLCEKNRKDIWRSNNLDHHNKKTREWRISNLEKATSSNAKYYEKTKDFWKEYHSKWRRENKNKVNLSTATRRKRIKLATPKLSEFDELYIIEIYDLSMRRGLEVDHIVPITHGKVCGLHVPENLQLLTKSQNCSKGNKYDCT